MGGLWFCYLFFLLTKRDGVLTMLEYLWAKFFKKLRGRAITASTIHKTSKVEAGSTVVNSSFARHSFCGYDCTIVNCDIGGFCSIANGVSIGVAGRHPLDFVSTSPVFLAHRASMKAKFSRHEYSVDLRTEVESDVWIGERALVKAGVRVGVGAVIGMGSVVTKDVPPYTIVGGNPARTIKQRFDEETIKALCELQWWELPEKEIKELAIDFNDVAALLLLQQRKDI